ncbi:MAG: apolipoprotein N-acyltransferase [Desulfobulbaceae bacterium DB1]|nr:MAG: apolipoprotein N-acyltransferase [Desulfobulbaceae bacterium DB1]
MSAMLLWLASPGPGFSALAWFALIPLIIGCSGILPRQAALFGFTAGLLYYLLMLYWVVISLSTYGNLPWWLCAIALILLAAYMSLYLAFFCAGLSWSMRTTAPVWIGPLLWVALDYVRGFLFSGFPWQDAGYTQFSNSLLIQTADLAGHHGITFLLVLTNCLLATLLLPTPKKRAWRGKTLLQCGSAFALLGAAFFYSSLRLENITADMATAPRHQVTVVQGNIDQNQKWLPENQQDTVEHYINLSVEEAKRHKSRLVIWPETAMPFYPPTSHLFPELLNRTVFSHDFSLLAGAPYFVDSDGTKEFYNSAMLIRPDASRSIYFKQHLVPFGEYIPLSDVLPLPGPVVQTVGNFSRGRSAEPLVDGNARLGILICFESIFPDLARRTVQGGANLLVNITNDAWFGRSSASIQHLSMAVLRAVENRRSLARAANTGISCFIDPAGRISGQTPLFVAAKESADLPLLMQPAFFTRTGHLFPVLCLFLLIPLAILIRKGRKTTPLS